MCSSEENKNKIFVDYNRAVKTCVSKHEHKLIRNNMRGILDDSKQTYQLCLTCQTSFKPQYRIQHCRSKRHSVNLKLYEITSDVA